MTCDGLGKQMTMQNRNIHGGIDERDEIRCAEGAAQQLEQILASGLPSLYRTAYSILGNRADAEDAVQDALLTAYTRLNQFRGRAETSTWLTIIVLICARMHLRRRSRHIHLSLDESNGELQQPLSVSGWLADDRLNPEDQFTESELSAGWSHLHRQLSPTVRKAFQLRDIDGLSIRETARILGVLTGTLKAHPARSRGRLTVLMQRTLRPADRV